MPRQAIYYYYFYKNDTAATSSPGCCCCCGRKRRRRMYEVAERHTFHKMQQSCVGSLLLLWGLVWITHKSNKKLKLFFEMDIIGHFRRTVLIQKTCYIKLLFGWVLVRVPNTFFLQRVCVSWQLLTGENGVKVCGTSQLLYPFSINN